MNNNDFVIYGNDSLVCLHGQPRQRVGRVSVIANNRRDGISFREIKRIGGRQYRLYKANGGKNFQSIMTKIITNNGPIVNIARIPNYMSDKYLKRAQGRPYGYVIKIPNYKLARARLGRVNFFHRTIRRRNKNYAHLLRANHFIKREIDRYNASL